MSQSILKKISSKVLRKDDKPKKPLSPEVQAQQQVWKHVLFGEKPPKELLKTAFPPLATKIDIESLQQQIDEIQKQLATLQAHQHEQVDDE